MAIEQWGFFSMPHILWHGTSVNNGHLRGHSHLLQSVLHETAFTWFNDLDLSRVGFEHPSFRLPSERSNRLRHRRANRRYITNNCLIFVCIHIYIAWIFLINMQCFKNFSPQLSFFPHSPLSHWKISGSSTRPLEILIAPKQILIMTTEWSTKIVNFTTVGFLCKVLTILVICWKCIISFKIFSFAEHRSDKRRMYMY